jgi:alanine-glyoxylate transaminase/serine-glyoxylate transaminase/serine-pyruvate transaminase
MLSRRHTLQIPGPSPVPDRIREAIGRQVIDHRGPDFARLTMKVLDGSKRIFQTGGPVVIFPSSGTGAWEAAVVNTLSPGDRVVLAETGHFSSLWKKLVEKWGVVVDYVAGDWRRGADLDGIEQLLTADRGHEIKAVMIVHNETSTGAVSDVRGVREVLDRASHPALLLVDAISSLGCVELRHDEWGVDVTISCSQKGLMLPPGLGLLAISEKALAASLVNRLPRSYWDWSVMLESNATGFFPYTPATNLLYGLREATAMLLDEGLDAVFERHLKLAAATREAVLGWGFEILCADPTAHSPVLTAVVLPDGHDADRFREVALAKFNISLGTGLGKLKGRVFRIGHLGDCDSVALLGVLGGIEAALAAADVPHERRGVGRAIRYLERGAGQSVKSAAVESANAEAIVDQLRRTGICDAV